MTSIPYIVIPNEPAPAYSIQQETSRENHANYEEYNETEPLLHRRRTNISYLFISFLITVLCIGAAVGIYLLNEEREWDSDEANSEILENSFGTLLNVMQLSRSEFPLSKVLLSEIHGLQCNTSESCYKQVLKLQSRNISSSKQPKQFFMYNFLVTVEGNTFEYLGWDLSSASCDNNTLHIAVGGKIDAEAPTDQQLIQVRTLLDSGIHSNKLSRCYSVSISSDSSNSSRTLLDYANNINSDNKLKYHC